MASSEYSEIWIDEISRYTETPEFDSEPSTDLKPDEYFYGFHGLEQEILYRVLRCGEDIEKEIVCKNPDSTRTVEQHIASGSKYGSRFISTTKDREVAALWAFYEMETPERKPRDEPLKIVEISVKTFIGTETGMKCINLCNKEVREHFIKGATHRSWAISSQEVLFQERIPEYVANTVPWPGNFLVPTYQWTGNFLTLTYLRTGIFFTPTYTWTRDFLVYHLTTDVQKPPQPPPKKPKKKVDDSSLDEMMASLSLDHYFN